MGNGIPALLLHGVSSDGGIRDEIITFGLLASLVVGLAILAFRRGRNKNR